MRPYRHLLLLAFATISILTQGQTPNGLLSDIDEINITLGPNLSSLYNENITSEIRQPKIGLSTRLGLIYRLSSKFSLNANLIYERKGLKTKFRTSYYDPSKDTNNCMCTTSIGFSEVNTSLDYFVVSTLVRFQPSNLNLKLSAGPFVGYLFKARTKTTNLWDDSYYYSNALDSFKRTDFGITLSIGYTIKFNQKMGFVIQLSDDIGLLNISESNTKTSTNAFSASLGLNLLINSSN